MIIVISGVTGSGVETMALFLSNILHVPAYRGDDLGHWDINKAYGKWIYEDESLDLRNYFDMQGMEIGAIVAITDGADRSVLSRVKAMSHDLPMLTIRYYVDCQRTLGARVNMWRKAHDLGPLEYGSNWSFDPASWIEHSEYQCVEDARVSIDKSANMMIPCSRTIAGLRSILNTLAEWHPVLTGSQECNVLHYTRVFENGPDHDFDRCYHVADSLKCKCEKMEEYVRFLSTHPSMNATYGDLARRMHEVVHFIRDTISNIKLKRFPAVSETGTNA